MNCFKCGSCVQDLCDDNWKKFVNLHTNLTQHPAVNRKGHPVAAESECGASLLFWRLFFSYHFLSSSQHSFLPSSLSPLVPFSN